MNAKEYLSQARFLDARINAKIKQLDGLNTLATNATSVLSGMPHSPNRGTSKLETIIVKIVDLQEESTTTLMNWWISKGQSLL